MYPGYKSGYNSVMNNSKLGYSHGLSPFPTMQRKKIKTHGQNAPVRSEVVLSGESLMLENCKL